MEQDSLRSDEQQDKQIIAVTNELRRLVIRHPKNNPADLLVMARNNIDVRSANIGGDWIAMKDNIKQAMFGDKVSNYDQDGIEHKVVLSWLASPQMQARGAHPGLGNVGFVEQLFPFLGELSMADSNAALRRGVRPFRSYVGGNGELYIEYTTQDGNVGETIRIDLEAAGAYYMEKTNTASDLR